MQLRPMACHTLYLLFEGEQHGFRQAETLIRAQEAELSFYAQVFGFEPAGEITPIELVRPGAEPVAEVPEPGSELAD